MQLGLDSELQGSKVDGEEAEFEGVTVPERARCNRLGHTVSDLCPNVGDPLSYSSSQEGREEQGFLQTALTWRVK